MGSDYEYFRPGASGYNAKLTHGGYKSMHRLGESDEEQDVLLNYTDPLQIGQEYTIYFWICTDQENARLDVSLVHNTWPDIAEPIAGVEKMAEITDLEPEAWKQYSYTFTAKAEYVSIRTSGGVSAYLDDVMILATGALQPEKQPDEQPDVSTPEVSGPDTGVAAPLLPFAAAMLAGGAVAALLGTKKARKD